MHQTDPGGKGKAGNVAAGDMDEKNQRMVSGTETEQEVHNYRCPDGVDADGGLFYRVFPQYAE